MFDTSNPLRGANGRSACGRIAHRRAGEGVENDLSVPCLVATATWAVGLSVGVVALLGGQVAMAIVALVVAVVAPLLGLAWVSQGQRRIYNVALYLHGSRSNGPAELPGSQYGLRFTAR